MHSYVGSTSVLLDNNIIAINQKLTNHLSIKKLTNSLYKKLCRFESLSIEDKVMTAYQLQSYPIYQPVHIKEESIHYFKFAELSRLPYCA